MIVGKLVLGTGAEAARRSRENIRLNGIKLVWGIPVECKPVLGWQRDPVQRMRFRFRAGKAGLCWLRTSRGITECILRDDGETWGLIPRAENRTA